MCGVEDRPERCGEICVAEIFGSDVRPSRARVGMGIKAFADPLLREEFSADEYPIDATELHTYAVLWTDAGIEFRLDGQRVKTTSQSPTYPMQLMLAIYEVPGRIDPDHAGRYPKPFVVDRVRGYV
jgi:hypothetical protein